MVALIVGCNSSEPKLNAEERIAADFNAEVKVEQITGEDGFPKIKYIVSNSTMLDSLPPSVASTAIALIAIKELSDENKAEMEELDVDLFDTGNKQIAGFSFKIKEFQSDVEKMDIFNELSKDILEKRYNEMVSKRLKEVVADNGISDNLKKKMRFLNSRYGSLKGYRLFGVAEETSKDGTYIQYQGYLDFEKRSVPYIFAFFAESGKDQWIGFDIKN